MPSRSNNHTIPVPPTPASPVYDPSADPNRISTASGYGTSAIGAMLTAPGDSAYGDSDSDSDEYAYNTSAASDTRARLRKQVSQQNKSPGRKAVPSIAPITEERVMSPVSDYSEADRDNRAISGMWGTAAPASRGTSPIPTSRFGVNGDATEELEQPDVSFAKGGDRRSVVTRQNVNAGHLRSITGELDRDDATSVGGTSAGRVSAGPEHTHNMGGSPFRSGADGPAGGGPYFVPLAEEAQASASLSPSHSPTKVASRAEKRRSIPKGLSEEVLEDDQQRREAAKVQGGSGIMKRQGEEGADPRYNGKRVTIVDFPSPSIGGVRGGYDGRPSYEHGQGDAQSQQYSHQPQPQQYDTYGTAPNTYLSHPAQTHPGPISSPHLQALPSSSSLPALHIPSMTHDHYPAASPSPSHTGGFFSQGSYARIGSSSPNLGPSSVYQQQQQPYGHDMHLQRPGPITIDLPPPQSPISPMLAAPPSAHPGRMGSPRHVHSAMPSSMLSGAPGAVDSVHSQSTGAGPFQGNANRLSISSTNESIRGFDFLKEKNALFRGGEEDILGFNPRGPQKRQKPGRSGLGKNGAASRLMTTVDFWKRMSVMRVQGQDEKERCVSSTLTAEKQ